MTEKNFNWNKYSVLKYLPGFSLVYYFSEGHNNDKINNVSPWLREAKKYLHCIYFGSWVAFLAGVIAFASPGGLEKKLDKEITTNQAAHELCLEQNTNYSLK